MVMLASIQPTKVSLGIQDKLCVSQVGVFRQGKVEVKASQGVNLGPTTG